MERYVRMPFDARSDFDEPSSDNCSRISTICRGNTFVETEEEKLRRKRSHFVVCTSVFIWSIGISLSIPGIFPYLKLLEDDPHLSKTKMGWVIAVNSIGMMIFSPILGMISHTFGSIRCVSYFSLITFFIASILYGLLPYLNDLWDHSAYHLMIVSRLMVGISSGNFAACRAYLASSTTLKERTTVLNYQSASRSFGIILGSVSSMILMVTITDDQIQYQATGYVPAILSIIAFILFIPLIFKEYDTSKMTLQSPDSANERQKVPKPDYTGMISLMFCSFAFLFSYGLLETMLTPLVLDQYGWCDEMAVVVVGIILAFSGVIFMINFIVSAKISRKFDERKILLGFGCGLTLLGLLVLVPYGGNDLVYCEPGDSLKISDYNSVWHTIDQMEGYRLSGHYEIQSGENSTDGKIFNYFCSNVTDCLGCPPEQVWCKTVPQLPFAQFIIALCLIIYSFPYGIAMTGTLFSKMLGPNSQGLWMGLLSSASSLARISGPIAVSHIYSEFGTRYMAGLIFIVMLLATIEISCLFQRLIPMKLDSESNTSDKY